MRSLALSAAAAAGLASCPTDAGAAVYLVDLNTTDTTGYPSGTTWNAYAAPADLTAAAVALVDSSGAASPTAPTLRLAGTITDSTQPASAVFSNATNTQPSWATSSTGNSASGDYFFTSTNASLDSFTMTFANLTPGNTFSLDVLASRNDGGSRGFYTYSLDGGATTSGLNVLNADGTPQTTDWNGFNTKTREFHGVNDGFTPHRYMNVENVTLTGSTLQLTVTDTGNYSTINAVRLTVVPEPATAGLAAAAGLLMLARRRRPASA